MTKTRTRSLAKGALAGLIGGIVGAAAKKAAERFYPPSSKHQSAAALMARKVTKRELTARQKRVAESSLHIGLGAAAGAAYGAAAEIYPTATAKQGASFGMALVALSHDSPLSALGLTPGTTEQTSRERTSEVASYVVYGVVTELVRRIVRHAID